MHFTRDTAGFNDLSASATAFSLLVLTERPHPTRLFLKKSRTSLLCPVQSRSENALSLDRDHGGQGELKGCTPPGGAGGPQAAAMRLNDRAADGKPHTRPFIFGRKKCAENLVRRLGGQS